MEGFPIKVTKSAETDYKIDASDSEMMAAKFMSDPIAALDELRDESMMLYGHQDYVAQDAVERMRTMRDTMHQRFTETSCDAFNAFMTTEPANTAAERRTLVELLKTAGYEKPEVVTWLLVDTEGELSKKEAVNLIDSIYGE